MEPKPKATVNIRPDHRLAFCCHFGNRGMMMARRPPKEREQSRQSRQAEFAVTLSWAVVMAFFILLAMASIHT